MISRESSRLVKKIASDILGIIRVKALSWRISRQGFIVVGSKIKY
jgi:hypothetical protein